MAEPGREFDLKTPLTEKELEAPFRALEPVGEHGESGFEQRIAEMNRTLDALQSDKDAPVNSEDKEMLRREIVYNQSLIRVADELQDYQTRLDAEWEKANHGAYLDISLDMKELRDEVENMLRSESLSARIRNKPLEEALAQQFSRMLAEDSERIQEFEKAAEYQKMYRRHEETKTLKLNVDDVRKKIMAMHGADQGAPMEADSNTIEVEPEPVEVEPLPEDELITVEPLPEDAPTEVEPLSEHQEKMDPRKEEYLMKINVLASELKALRQAFEIAAKRSGGNPTQKQVIDLHDGLDSIRAELRKLNEDTDADVRAQAEYAGDDLLRAMQAYQNEHPIHIPVDIAGARADLRQAHAQYASLSHRLDQDSRRAFRSRLASMAGAVRKMEDRKWHELLGHRIRNHRREYIKSRTHVGAAARIKMTRASRLAPILASAVEMSGGSAIRPQGILESIIKNIRNG